MEAPDGFNREEKMSKEPYVTQQAFYATLKSGFVCSARKKTCCA